MLPAPSHTEPLLTTHTAFYIDTPPRTPRGGVPREKRPFAWPRLEATRRAKFAGARATPITARYSGRSPT
jgi:hypothetical protein